MNKSTPSHMPETLEAPVENKIKTIEPEGYSDIGDFLIDKLKAKDTAPNSNQQVPKDESDLTESFKTKYAPLQKEGNVEEINKLRAEIQEQVKSGKKVSADFLKQLELDSETPEQKQIRELTAQKEAITNDLKLSEVEKTEALKKLDSIKEPNYWETPEFDKTNIPATVENTDKNKEEVLKILSEKAKQYDAIYNDEFLKAYISAKESGKPVGEFLSELNKENPATLTDAQVLESSITRSGLTAEEAEEQREHFKSMSPIYKKEMIANERALLNKDYKKNFEKYSTSNVAEREKTISIAKQAIKETNDYLTNIQNKEVWGIQYDSTQTQKLEEWAKNVMENGLFKEDGSWDIPRIMRLGMKELNTQHMLQKAYEKGQYVTNEEWYKKYGRPSNNNGIAKIPEASIVNKTQEERKKQDEQWRKSL